MRDFNVVTLWEFNKSKWDFVDSYTTDDNGLNITKSKYVPDARWSYTYFVHPENLDDDDETECPKPTNSRAAVMWDFTKGIRLIDIEITPYPILPLTIDFIKYCNGNIYCLTNGYEIEDKTMEEVKKLLGDR